MTNQGLTDSLVSGYEVVLLMGAGQLCRTKNPKEARQLKINKCTFATHGRGDQPSWDNKTEVADFQLVSYVSHSLNEGNWIINIDLDYFFYTNYDTECRSLHSDEYVEELFGKIATIYKAGRIAVITLCLSPETCGGWGPAENLASRICGTLDLPFELPQ